MNNVTYRTPKQVYQLWIDALNSGKYRQTGGTLRRTKRTANSVHHKYCCLGVLCDLARKDGGSRWQPMAQYCYVKSSYMDSGFTLPKPIANYLGLRQSDVEALIGMNDESGASFEQIAAYIQHDLAPSALRRLAQS